MFYLVMALIALIIILTIVFTINHFKDFSCIRRIKESSKTKYYIIISIFCILLGVLLYLDFINVIVVLLHFLIISTILSIILRILGVKKGDVVTIISMLLTTVYIGYGVYMATNVKATTYNLKTTKEIENLKIAAISDAHIGTTFDGEGFQKYALEIAKKKPDVLVILGDFVDDSTTKKDMKKAIEVFKDIKLKYGIYFIYGNHDKGLMKGRNFSKEDLKDELTKNGVKILEDETALLGDNIILVGRKDKSVTERASASRLVDNLDESKYIIVLDHQPNDYTLLSKTKADLVLSGHTHGGQILPLGKIGLMIGANDRVYGHEKRKNTDFIVTSGISGWALKIKTGTVSEYLIINVSKSKS